MPPVATKPLEVRLDACPHCRRVGKLPTESWSGKSLCRGRVGEMHPKARMQSRRFREVVAEEASP
jgi:hypothetical protein